MRGARAPASACSRGARPRRTPNRSRRRSRRRPSLSGRCPAWRARSGASSSVSSIWPDSRRAPRRPPAQRASASAPVEQHRLVAREEAAVVVQHAQAVRARSRRRSSRCRSRRASPLARPRYGQLVIEARWRRRAGRSARARPGQPSRRPQELVAERRRAARGARRDRRSCGCPARAAARLAHRRARSVLSNPSGPMKPTPARGQRGPQRGRVRRRRCGLQDLLAQRAGVLGVDVERARDQRVPAEPRAAQRRPMLDGRSGGRRQQTRRRSPRITDSVKAFEPTRSGGAAASGWRATQRATTASSASDEPRASSPGPPSRPIPRQPPLGLDELGHERVGRRAQQRRRSALLDDAPVAQQDDAVARRTPPRPDRASRRAPPCASRAKIARQIVLQLGADQRIEGAQRLVEQQQRRGRASSARIRPTRWRWPPESCAG